MPYPNTQHYIFDEGLDPTAVFGGYASTILEAIRLAKPNAYRGSVIYNASTPAVTGEPVGYPTNWYEWQKRCLWIHPTTGKAYAYRTGLGWENIANKIDAGTVVGSMIAAGTITLDKLSISGGAALRVLRINAANTGAEWADINSIVGAGSLNVNALVGAGAGNWFLKSAGGVVAWDLFDSATVLSLFSASEIPVNFLTHGTADQVVAMNSAGTAVTWSSVVSKIADKALTIAKLSPGTGNGSKVVRVDPTGAQLEFATLSVPTAPNIQRVTNDVAIPGTVSTTAVSAHGLAGIPTIVHGALKCVTGEAGYSANDLVAFDVMVGDDGSGSYDDDVFITLSWDATNVTVTRGPQTTLEIKHKTTGVRASFTPANWTVVYTAVRYY